MKAKRIIYWIVTILLCLAQLSGGIAEVSQQPQNIAGMARLGYPAYVATILGVWKILAVIALLAPRLPRLKEWAYAGIFFDLSGAVISHAVCHDYGAGAFHLIVPSVLIVLAIVSWALRPQSRWIG